MIVSKLACNDEISEGGCSGDGGQSPSSKVIHVNDGKYTVEGEHILE